MTLTTRALLSTGALVVLIFVTASWLEPRFNEKTVFSVKKIIAVIAVTILGAPKLFFIFGIKNREYLRLRSSSPDPQFGMHVHEFHRMCTIFA